MPKTARFTLILFALLAAGTVTAVRFEQKRMYDAAHPVVAEPVRVVEEETATPLPVDALQLMLKDPPRAERDELSLTPDGNQAVRPSADDAAPVPAQR